MIKIDQIIWSRSRASQLDLLLRSTKDHFKNVGNIFILYKADNEQFEQGYKKLIEKDYGLNIEYIREINFEEDIKNILSNKMQTEYVLGNSDDNVFIRDINFDYFKLGNGTVAFSLRMGKSFNYCLPADLKMNLPDFIIEIPVEKVGNSLLWNWTGCDRRGGWGYPHPVDSNVYRKNYWVNLLKDKHFTNPKEMEEQMDWNRNVDYPYMASFSESRLVSICANELGQGSNLKNSNMSIEELNNKFLNNYIISTDNIYNMNVNSCHILLDYNFIKEE